MSTKHNCNYHRTNQDVKIKCALHQSELIQEILVTRHTQIEKRLDTEWSRIFCFKLVFWKQSFIFICNNNASYDYYRDRLRSSRSWRGQLQPIVYIVGQRSGVHICRLRMCTVGENFSHDWLREHYADRVSASLRFASKSWWWWWLFRYQSAVNRSTFVPQQADSSACRTPATLVSHWVALGRPQYWEYPRRRVRQCHRSRLARYGP